MVRVLAKSLCGQSLPPAEAQSAACWVDPGAGPLPGERHWGCAAACQRKWGLCSYRGKEKVLATLGRSRLAVRRGVGLAGWVAGFHSRFLQARICLLAE